MLKFFKSLSDTISHLGLSVHFVDNVHLALAMDGQFLLLAAVRWIDQKAIRMVDRWKALKVFCLI